MTLLSKLGTGVGLVAALFFGSVSRADPVKETPEARILRWAQSAPDPSVRLEKLAELNVLFEHGKVSRAGYQGALRYLLRDSHVVVFLGAWVMLHERFKPGFAAKAGLEVLGGSPFRGFTAGDDLDEGELILRRQFLLDLVLHETDPGMLPSVTWALSKMYRQDLVVAKGLILKAAEMCDRVSENGTKVSALKNHCLREVVPLLERIRWFAWIHRKPGWKKTEKMAAYAERRTRGVARGKNEATFSQLIDEYVSFVGPVIEEKLLRLVLLRDVETQMRLYLRDKPEDLFGPVDPVPLKNAA